MKKIIRYLPQLLVFIVESILIWSTISIRVRNGNTQELTSIEYLIFLFIIIVFGYGVACVLEPKDKN